MDSFIFQALAIELKKKIAGSRLDKVVQPTGGSLLFKFWTGTEKVQLLVRAESPAACHLTATQFPAPAKPPRVCQLLRARLRRLVEVKAEPLDRIVHFIFAGPDGTSYDLVFEALGNQANMILVDEEGVIVDLLYRRENQRNLLPGETYVLPQQQERLSLFAPVADAAAALRADESAGRITFPSIAPMSPVLAESILQARQSGQSFEAILTRINEIFKMGKFAPQKASINNRVGFMPLSLTSDQSSLEVYADLSELVEKGQLDQAEDHAKDLVMRMRAIIRKQFKFLAKRKEKIAAESKRQSNPEQFKIYGELLLSNLHNFQRGDEAVEVDNFYENPVVRTRIELDVKATPNENAERYFKLYRKAKRSGEHHARRLRETEEEIAWLEQLELSLDEADTGDDLYQVQLELEQAGLLKEAKGQLGKRKPARPEDQLYKATTPGGWPLFWGKNSRTNDYVSRSAAAADDFWFHAKGMPGAHLVLKCGDSADKVNEEDILYAASIAAGYSKGRDAGKVEVIVAKGSDVKKPKGAKPGLVTVDSYRSVIVNPIRVNIS